MVFSKWLLQYIIKKLKQLYGGEVFLPSDENCITNLSSHSPTPQEQRILNKGLNFSIPKKSDNLRTKIEVEKLFCQLESDQNDGKINIEDEEDLKTRLKHFAITSATKENSKSNISKEEYAALKSLQRNNNIVIKRPDKGAGVVILDQQDYNDKLQSLIDNQSKFKTCSPKQSLHVKAKMNEIAKTYKETNPNTYKNLFIIGEFHPGQLYELPKIHKNSTNTPLRPIYIISMTGTVTHALAQYLNKIIQPYINSTYIIRSSDELLVHLSQLHLQLSHQLLSLDVESLFTSVPVEDTISIILQEAYNHPTQPPPDIQRNHLQELLKICTTQTPFNFNGNTFVQSDGVSIGSRWGPHLLILICPIWKTNFYPRIIRNQTPFFM